MWLLMVQAAPVAHQFLDGADVLSLLQLVRRKGVAERVWGGRFAAHCR